MQGTPIPDSDYPDYIAATIVAYLDDGHDAGAEAIAPIAAKMWNEKIIRPKVARTTVLPNAGSGQRRFTPALAAATFRRDRFQCRYCRIRTVPVALMSLLSHLYPAQLPYVSTYNAGAMHRAYWTIGAEADHIVPGSRGGDWLDPNNHATACVLCNTRKADATLDELGWELKDVPDSDWDGLVGLYRRFWDKAGRPNPPYHTGWIRALEGG